MFWKTRTRRQADEIKRLVAQLIDETRRRKAAENELVTVRQRIFVIEQLLDDMAKFRLRNLHAGAGIWERVEQLRAKRQHDVRA